MDQSARRPLARCRAVLVTPLVVLGMIAGTAPAAAAAPASALAAIRTSLWAAVSAAGYSQQAELTAADAASGDGFGDSVTLSASGRTALVGAQYAGTGTAYVFTLRHGTWSQTAELTDHAAQFDDFGASVALSASGSTALAGAPEHNNAAGALYVFTLRRGTWSRTAVLTASNGTHADNLGNSVAVSGQGSTALAGMDSRYPFTGAVYVFTLRHGAWSQTAELTASDAAPGDEFGDSLALSASGSTVLAGAPFRTNTGAVYVFTEAVRRLSA